MASTYQEILGQLKNNQYAPVYFFQGEEPYHIDRLVHYIEHHAMDEGMRGFNQIVLYGKDADLGDILSHAKGYPMMSDRKVVIIKEAQDLSGLNKEESEKYIIAYLENPQPSTVLVFAHKYKSLDKRKKLGKAFEKHSVYFTSGNLYDNQLPDWVDTYVKSKGKKIEQKAVLLIVENIGNNLTRIANEIDKMLINVNQEDLIKEDHVYKYIGISKEYNVFELQKALAFRSAVKAYKIVDYFKSDPKSNPIIPIVSNLFTFYQKLLLIHHADDKSERNLASLLGVHPFFLKEYLMAAKNYNINNVIANIRHIRVADMKTKGIDHPSLSEGEILRELVFSLLH